MNFFRLHAQKLNGDEGLTLAQIKKKRLRKKMCRPDNEPIFKGKVSLSLKELQKANEIWLVKLTCDVRPERFEGHDIVLHNNATSILELNNGSVQDACFIGFIT